MPGTTIACLTIVGGLRVSRSALDRSCMTTKPTRGLLELTILARQTRDRKLHILLNLAQLVAQVRHTEVILAAGLSEKIRCRKILIREERRLAAAHITERHRHYTLDGYETAFRGADPSLGRAHLTARKFPFLMK